MRSLLQARGTDACQTSHVDFQLSTEVKIRRMYETQVVQYVFVDVGATYHSVENVRV